MAFKVEAVPSCSFAATLRKRKKLQLSSALVGLVTTDHGNEARDEEC